MRELPVELPSKFRGLRKTPYNCLFSTLLYIAITRKLGFFGILFILFPT
jgi:hypothetical protein